jgi:hypothetical protein
VKSRFIVSIRIAAKITIRTMWLRLHHLGQVQSLIVASVSAALISGALTIRLASGDQTAVRVLFWPDYMNAFITFSIVLIGVIFPLLGYYDLGRLGTADSAAGFATTWLMAVCAFLSFAYSTNVLLSFATYAECVAMSYVTLR